jgi:hypothetical protein
VTPQAGPSEGSDGRLKARKIGLVAATALVSINIWAGSPLLALWVGSKLQSSSGLTMGVVLIVLAVLAASVSGLAWLLTRLNNRYDVLTGRPPAARQASPWLRSTRGERETDIRAKEGISAVERIVVVSVVAAVLAFEVWFFFFAGSSLPGGG